jgi:hypothetical protein
LFGLCRKGSRSKVNLQVRSWIAKVIYSNAPPLPPKSKRNSQTGWGSFPEMVFRNLYPVAHPLCVMFSKMLGALVYICWRVSILYSSPRSRINLTRCHQRKDIFSGGRLVNGNYPPPHAPLKQLPRLL